jgi:hypothetical protein
MWAKWPAAQLDTLGAIEYDGVIWWGPQVDMLMPRGRIDTT